MTDYYKSSAEESLRELQTGPTGLTSQQAHARQEKYGINKLKEAEKPGFLKRFFLQLKDPMLLILLAAAAVMPLPPKKSAASIPSLEDALMIRSKRASGFCVAYSVRSSAWELTAFKSVRTSSKGIPGTSSK